MREGIVVEKLHGDCCAELFEGFEETNEKSRAEEVVYHAL